MWALAILLLGAASVRWPAFGPATIDTGWLIAPIAAWLVQRFGRPAWFAVIAILVFGVLLQSSLDRDSVVIGGRADMAILALGCAGLARRGLDLRDIVRMPPLARRWMLAPLALPLFFAVPVLASDDLGFALPWYVLGLLLPLLFVAALRGADWRGFAASAVVAIALGAGLALAARGRIRAGDWALGYSFMQPYLWLPAIAAWSSGEALRRATLGQPPRRFWSASLLACCAILLLWLDPAQFAMPIDLRIGRGDLGWLFVTGTAVALPLAGFVAGALMGLSGAWLIAALALLPGIIAFGLLWTSDGQIHARIGNVAAAPIALAWGWLGAGLFGRATSVPSLRIPAAALLAGCAAVVVFSERSAGVTLALSASAAVVTAAIAAFVARTARRLGVSGEGWIPVLLLPLYGFGVVTLGPTMAEALREEGVDLFRQLATSSAEEILFRLLLVLPAVVGSALAIREILRGITMVPKILRDLTVLAIAARTAWR